MRLAGRGRPLCAVPSLQAGKAPDDLKQVPEEFTSTEQYVSVFEPLMVQECLAQVVHGADEIASERKRFAHGHFRRVAWLPQ